MDRHDVRRAPVLAAALVLGGLWAAAATGLLLGNATPSVPRGLYLRAGPETGGYVTFCLGTRHRGAVWYGDHCSPDRPDGPLILKRVAARLPEGAVTVEGDTPRALDSRHLGPIPPERIRGWWRPVMVTGSDRPDGTAP